MKCLIKAVLRAAAHTASAGMSPRSVRTGVRLLVVASAMPLLVAQAAPTPEFGRVSDFPTTARVEYVLECMKNHDGKYEYMYKCSCAIDQIASRVNYDDFVEISTALRHQSLGGERGAEFRDPKEVKQMASRYKKIQEESADACFIK